MPRGYVTGGLGVAVASSRLTSWEFPQVSILAVSGLSDIFGLTFSFFFVLSSDGA